MKKKNKVTEVTRSKAIKMVDEAIIGKKNASCRYDDMRSLAWAIVRERIDAKKPNKDVERIANKIIALHDKARVLTKKINALGWYVYQDVENGTEVTKVRWNSSSSEQEAMFAKIMEELIALHRSLIHEIGECETIEEVFAVVKKADELALKYKV